MSDDGAARAIAPVVAPPKVSTGQDFCNLIAGPYQTHLCSLAELRERSATVAALEPPRLAAVLRDGTALRVAAVAKDGGLDCGLAGATRASGRPAFCLVKHAVERHVE